MARPKPFTQTDLTRAVKGVVKAGITVGRVEIDPAGKITIITGEPESAAPVSALDEYRKRRGSR